MIFYVFFKVRIFPEVVTGWFPVHKKLHKGQHFLNKAILKSIAYT